MTLRDITNKQSKFRLHVDLDGEYATLRSTQTDAQLSTQQLRMQGCKAIDLWTDGRLYPIDPLSSTHPPFQTMTSMIRFIGDGWNGLLGYCIRLHSQSLNEAAQRMQMQSALNQSNAKVHELTERIKALLEKESELKLNMEERKKSFQRVSDNYVRLQYSTRNMRRRIDHFTNLQMGYHARQRKRKALDDLAKSGGAHKQRVRATRHHGKTHGLLMPLPIPQGPWEEISMNFITGFPPTSSHNDMIWTIVDTFSKQAYFIPCKKPLSAPQAAKMFLDLIFPHHGFPKVLISDRDVCFCNHFWSTLCKNLGSKMDFTFAFHPESNGQIEATNSTILDLLRSYTIENQPNWDQHLLLLQFAYNNTPHFATNKSPSEIVYGKKLPVPITTLSSDVPAANALAHDHAHILQEVTTAIQKAQARYTAQANYEGHTLDLTTPTSSLSPLVTTLGTGPTPTSSLSHLTALGIGRSQSMSIPPTWDRHLDRALPSLDHRQDRTLSTVVPTQWG
ncbi:hypothetical protein L7F22_020893 [Adiantum nelumboides]|nr:hypothetical protein [Adiantum nelumboides]